MDCVIRRLSKPPANAKVPVNVDGACDHACLCIPSLSYV